jgi:hypothetical protein
MTSTGLPDRIYPDTGIVQACSNAPAPVTKGFSLAVAYTRQSSIQLTQSVQHTQNYTITFDTAKILPFKVGAQLVIGDQTTNSVATVDTSIQTVTRTDTDSITVNPGAVGVVQLRVWPVQYTLPFTTTVTVDADLSPNDKGFKLLSDVFPDPAVRTYPINGTLQADDASAGEVVEMTAPYDASLCDSDVTQHIGEHITPSKKVKLTRIQ